jgi:uncharacterized protein YukE
MYTTTPEGLRAAAADCRNTNENIRLRIMNMRTYMLHLSSVYRGPASVELLGVSQEWGVIGDQLNYVLSTISNGLTHNAVNYDAAEVDGTRNLRSVGSSMPPPRF